MRETREPLKRAREEVRARNPGPFANYTNAVLKGEQRTDQRELDLLQRGQVLQKVRRFKAEQRDEIKRTDRKKDG